VFQAEEIGWLRKHVADSHLYKFLIIRYRVGRGREGDSRGNPRKASGHELFQVMLRNV
jgi:hypothetical protein